MASERLRKFRCDTWSFLTCSAAQGPMLWTFVEEVNSLGKMEQLLKGWVNAKLIHQMPV